jgi:Holliday junction resolvase
MSVPNDVALYGPPKTGKSTTAATAPGPNLWVNAEGPGALAYARKTATQRGNQILEVRITRQTDARQVLRDVIKHVRDGIEPVPRTVTVDTVAKLREALIRQIVVPGAKNSIQQFGEVARILREFVQTMRDLPVNLVLIAHQNVEDAEGERIVRPLIGGALTEEIPGEVDVIAYTHSFKDDDSGDRRYVGQLVEAKGRTAGDRSGGEHRYGALEVAGTIMSRGHDRERQIKALLEKEDWLVTRAAGSLGVADLVALKAGRRPLLVECKSTAGGPYERFQPADRLQMLLAASIAGADATLCWWPPRGKPTWIPADSWPEAARASKAWAA